MDDTIIALESEAMRFVRHFLIASDRRADLRLDRSAYTILACLHDGQAMSVGELSDALGLDASTLSRQTASMLRAELVERIPDPAGGIARKLRATALGDARLREACEANARRLQDATEGWTSAELDAFTSALRRFNLRIEELDARHWPRLDEARSR